MRIGIDEALLDFEDLQQAWLEELDRRQPASGRNTRPTTTNEGASSDDEGLKFPIYIKFGASRRTVLAG
jgi:hypothetical protein